MPQPAFHSYSHAPCRNDTRRPAFRQSSANMCNSSMCGGGSQGAASGLPSPGACRAAGPAETEGAGAQGKHVGGVQGKVKLRPAPELEAVASLLLLRPQAASGQALALHREAAGGYEEERGRLGVSMRGSRWAGAGFPYEAASSEAREGRKTKSAVALSGCVHDCRFVPCQPCAACRAKCTCATTPAPPRGPLTCLRSR